MNDAPMRDEPPPGVDDLRELATGPLDIRSVALTGLFILMVFYTLYFARSFLLPIFLAVLLSFLLSPLVRALRRIGIPEALASAIVLLSLLASVGYGFYRLATP